jgi:hypothetical protein
VVEAVKKPEVEVEVVPVVEKNMDDQPQIAQVHSRLGPASYCL